MPDQHGYESEAWRGAAPQPWAGDVPPQPWPGTGPAGQDPAGQQPASRMSVPLVIGSVVALVAVLASVVVLIQSGGSRVTADAPPVFETPVAPSSPAPGSTSESSRPAPSSASAVDAGSTGTPVPLGERAEVADYVVAVTSVDLDADAIVEEANQFNDPPSGRYVIVEVDAQYVGDEEGNAFWDLSYVFNGTDARQYSDSDCSAVLPEDAIDAPTLNPGGSASFQVCMDVPPSAIDGGVLYIEPLASFDDEDRVFFALR